MIPPEGSPSHPLNETSVMPEDAMRHGCACVVPDSQCATNYGTVGPYHHRRASQKQRFSPCLCAGATRTTRNSRYWNGWGVKHRTHGDSCRQYRVPTQTTLPLQQNSRCINSGSFDRNIHDGRYRCTDDEQKKIIRRCESMSHNNTSVSQSVSPLARSTTNRTRDDC